MADKTVIVEVQYDTSQAIKNIENYTAAIEGAKVEQAGLKAQLEAGTISQKEYAIAVEQSKNGQNKANAERKATIQLLGSEKGSINELRARIKVLTDERNDLNLKTVEGQKRLKEINKTLDAHNETIKKSADGYLKQKLNIGNYKDALGSLPGPLGSVVSGIGGMTKAALAFIATPLGIVIAAIVLGLKALMSYFKGSEEGQNRLNKIMMVFKTIMGNLGDLVQAVGKWIYEAVSKPGETIKKLGELIKENLINRFKAFGVIGKAIVKIFKGDFKEGFKELANGAIQATTGVENAIDKVKNAALAAKNAIKGIIEENKKEIAIAKNLADRQAALDLLQRKFLVGRAKLEKEIAELRESAADKANMSDEERIKLLTEAMKKEDQILATNLKITQEKAALKKAQNALSNSTKEDLNDQAALEADIFNVQKENAMRKKEMTAQIAEIQNRLNAATKGQGEASKEANKEDEKAQNDILKRRGEAIWKLAELKNKELELEAKTIQAKRDAQIKAAEDEKTRALEAEGLLNEEKEVIESEHKARLIEIETDYQEQIRAQRQQALDEALAGMQQIIAASQEMSDKRVSIGLDAFSKLTTINWDEVKTSSDAFLAIGQAAQGLTSIITAGHEKESASLASQKAKELAAVEGNKEATDAVNKKFAKKEQQLKKKQFENDKKKALIDTAIATALAVVKGLASGLPMPGLLMAALAAVAGGISLATIASQQYTPTESFAKGGIIGGLPHSQGGTQFVGSDGSRFEAEKGEAMFVLKKDATAEIAALSAINESHGGQSFTRGASHLQEGGEVSPVGIERSIDEAIQRTPIFVRVGDIQTGLTDVEQSKKAGVI